MSRNPVLEAFTRGHQFDKTNSACGSTEELTIARLKTLSASLNDDMAIKKPATRTTCGVT